MRLPSAPATFQEVGEPLDPQFFQLLGLFLSGANGDFSALLQIPKTGSQYQIYDPATIAIAPAGRTSRQIFPNNIVPASRIDVTAKKYLNFWALPNAAGTVDGQTNFNEISSNSNDFDQNMVRVDHNFSDRHRLFGRFTSGDTTMPGIRGPALRKAWAGEPVVTWAIGGGGTWSWKPPCSSA